MIERSFGPASTWSMPTTSAQWHPPAGGFSSWSLSSMRPPVPGDKRRGVRMLPVLSPAAAPLRTWPLFSAPQSRPFKAASCSPCSRTRRCTESKRRSAPLSCCDSASFSISSQRRRAMSAAEEASRRHCSMSDDIVCCTPSTACCDLSSCRARRSSSLAIDSRSNPLPASASVCICRIVLSTASQRMRNLSASMDASRRQSFKASRSGLTDSTFSKRLDAALAMAMACCTSSETFTNRNSMDSNAMLAMASPCFWLACSPLSTSSTRRRRT
mmetsp:Transcript_84817/g.245241  ORF Transcript_84817/g.245241 Transcript_84817/m.245241 type:complete len:271 (+) Transcript_84817:687-1499(+)